MLRAVAASSQETIQQHPSVVGLLGTLTSLGQILWLFVTPMRMVGCLLHPSHNSSPMQPLCSAGGLLPTLQCCWGLLRCSHPASRCGAWDCSFPLVYEGKIPTSAVNLSPCFHQQTVTHLLYLPHLPFQLF